MSTARQANDLLINVDMGDNVQPDWMVRVKEDYFRADSSMFQSRELPELLDEMDANGVRRAIIMTNIKQPSKRAAAFAEQHPDRFFMGLGGHDLLRPMPTLKAPTEAFFFSRFES